MAKMAYDARGNKFKADSFDEEGKPTRWKDGYAMMTMAYDARGNRNAESYCGQKATRSGRRTAMPARRRHMTHAVTWSKRPTSRKRANRRGQRRVTRGLPKSTMPAGRSEKLPISTNRVIRRVRRTDMPRSERSMIPGAKPSDRRTSTKRVRKSLHPLSRNSPRPCA